jgi:hypothetical protein
MYYILSLLSKTLRNALVGDILHGLTLFFLLLDTMIFCLIYSQIFCRVLLVGISWEDVSSDVSLSEKESV